MQAQDVSPLPVAGESPLPLLEALEARTAYETLIRAHSDLGDGVVILEGERFLYVNDAFCRMTGFTREELCDPAFSVDVLWAPHERDRMRERMQRRLSGEVTEDHYEVALAPLWGPLVHVEVSVKPLPSPLGRPRMAVVRNVTERKLAREALDEARREASQIEKLAALGSLVSGVAHEVRTPLSYIQNHLALARNRLDVLEQGGEAPPEGLRLAREHLQAAEEGADRINRLVKDLGRFTRLPTEPTPCRLDEVVLEALELFRATRPGCAATILTELEATPVLRIDRAKVQQVVLNLLSNAADALPHGGTVRVGTRALPRGATLFVQDDGPGISPEAMGRIFEPFFTTKRNGMGFGLSIVRRIVELHHGTIRCQSKPGSGTVFTVHLPA